jgi:hypothetical protein
VITTAELREWSHITATDSETTAMLDECVAATNALIARRCVALTVWPSEVHTAALMQAARLYKRRGSPEGISGIADIGPIRIGAFDSDVEYQLSPYLKIVFA